MDHQTPVPGPSGTFLRAISNVGILGIRYQLSEAVTAMRFTSRIHETAGKQSGQSRRERPVEDTRRVSGGIEGVRKPVLYHEHDGRIGARVPAEDLDGDRGQAGGPAERQQRQAKVSDAHQLLWASGGNGRTGKSAVAAGAA